MVFFVQLDVNVPVIAHAHSFQLLFKSFRILENIFYLIKSLFCFFAIEISWLWVYVNLGHAYVIVVQVTTVVRIEVCLAVIVHLGHTSHHRIILNKDWAVKLLLNFLREEVLTIIIALRYKATHIDYIIYTLVELRIIMMFNCSCIMIFDLVYRIFITTHPEVVQFLTIILTLVELAWVLLHLCIISARLFKLTVIYCINVCSHLFAGCISPNRFCFISYLLWSDFCLICLLANCGRTSASFVLVLNINLLDVLLTVIQARFVTKLLDLFSLNYYRLDGGWVLIFSKTFSTI